jgi:nitrate reductase cytochrome c-type subunit
MGETPMIRKAANILSGRLRLRETTDADSQCLRTHQTNCSAKPQAAKIHQTRFCDKAADEPITPPRR